MESSFCLFLLSRVPSRKLIIEVGVCFSLLDNFLIVLKSLFFWVFCLFLFLLRKGKSSSHQHCPSKGSQKSSFFIKNFKKGIFPEKTFWSTIISSADWWLAKMKYQFFLFKNYEFSFSPMTFHSILCVRRRLRLFKKTHRLAIFM